MVPLEHSSEAADERPLTCDVAGGIELPSRDSDVLADPEILECDEHWRIHVDAVLTSADGQFAAL